MAETIMVETRESRIYRLRWWTLLVLTLSSVVVGLNTFILNVALPTIQSELGATGTQLQWIVNVYMMVAGAFVLTCGALGDRLGRAKFLQAGLVVFGLANLGAVFSTNATHLIIARVFMGVSVEKTLTQFHQVVLSPWVKLCGLWVAHSVRPKS